MLHRGKGSMFRFVLPLFVVLAATLVFSTALNAEEGVPAQPHAVGPPPLPEPLNEAAIRAVLSELDDRQVRALLLERLSIEAERQAQALQTANHAGFGDVVAGGIGALGVFLADVVVKAPRIPGEIQSAFMEFADRRGDVGLWRFFVTLVCALGLGLAAAVAVSRLIPETSGDAPNASDYGSLENARILALRFASQAAMVAVFAFTALALNGWINAGVAADRETIDRIVAAIGWPWFTLVIARFLFAPQRSDLRLCASAPSTMPRRAG